MVVTETEQQVCVELDTGAQISDYLEYIPSFSGVPASFKFDMGESLYGSSAEVSKINEYRAGSNMFTIKGDYVNNFPLPQGDVFGFCDNYKSPQFLESQTMSSCNQPVTDL